MLTLILGAAASGKSEYAEELLMSQPGERIYLATMEPWSEEGKARVEKHRNARKDRGFLTIERYTALNKLMLPASSNVLLEDLGNLVANELFSPAGGGEASVLSGLRYLVNCTSNLTVVSNELFSGGAAYAGDTLRYLAVLARANRLLAARADLVVEVVCGLPDIWKGAVPCAF